VPKPFDGDDWLFREALLLSFFIAACQPQIGVGPDPCPGPLRAGNTSVRRCVLKLRHPHLQTKTLSP
jgi:hypothetical protein